MTITTIKITLMIVIAMIIIIIIVTIIILIITTIMRINKTGFLIVMLVKIINCLIIFHYYYR